MRYKEENLSSANLWMMCASKLNNISDDVDFARVLSLIAIMNSQEENVNPTLLTSKIVYHIRGTLQRCQGHPS